MVGVRIPSILPNGIFLLSIAPQVTDSQLQFYDPSGGPPFPGLSELHEVWDVALICTNGHLVNDRSRGMPSLNAACCSICGAQPISACTGCREPIPGYYYRESGRPLERIPQYCHACGRPLPWTERSMSAARALIRELAALDPYERDQLRRSIDDIIRETPKTPLAIVRINQVLTRVGGEQARALREILISVASEPVKQRLR
jgi:hypothetical protein